MKDTYFSKEHYQWQPAGHSNLQIMVFWDSSYTSFVDTCQHLLDPKYVARTLLRKFVTCLPNYTASRARIKH